MDAVKVAAVVLGLGSTVGVIRLAADAHSALMALLIGVVWGAFVFALLVLVEIHRDRRPPG